MAEGRQKTKMGLRKAACKTRVYLSFKSIMFTTLTSTFVLHFFVPECRLIISKCH
jgi:hypothetical protein